MNVNIEKYFKPDVYLDDVVHTSSTAGLLKNDGTVDTNTYAQTSQLPSVATSSVVGLVKPDGSSITVDANGVLTAVGGSGNIKLKTRYSVTYSSWSSAVNSDGYYTYSLTLSPTLDTTVSPDVLIAGSSNITQPTDTEKTMFGYVERCYLSSGTLILYAKTKPTSTFYVWVEGVAGSGSGGIVGNVIQPNGAVSGGGNIFQPLINDSPILTLSAKKSDLTADGNLYSKVWDFGASYPTYKTLLRSCSLVFIEIVKYNSSTGKYLRCGMTIAHIDYKYDPNMPYASTDQIIVHSRYMLSTGKWQFFTDGNYTATTIDANGYNSMITNDELIARIYKLA